MKYIFAGLIASAALWGGAVYAGTDKLEALMNKSLKEAKEVGAAHEQKSVGHYYFVEGEYSHLSQDGKKENYPITWNPHELWGCNEAPNQVQVSNKFEQKQSVTNGDNEQYVASAYGVYFMDNTKSTRIWGHVIDKNGKAVKGAEVRAENIHKSESETDKTDSNGRYEMEVNSGQYSITVKAKECKSKPQTPWICGWGKAAEREEGRKRVESYEVPLVAECASEYTLNFSGFYSRSSKLEISEDGGGAFADGASGEGDVKASVPLSLDSETGKITGEGLLENGAVQSSVPMTVYADDLKLSDTGFHNVEASSWQVVVTGHLNKESNIASLVVECGNDGQEAVTSGNSYGSASGTHEACMEPRSWKFEFDIPWEQGTEYQLDRELPWGKWQEGNDYVEWHRHENITLTLGEEAEEDRKNDTESKDPERNEPETGNDDDTVTGGKRKTGGGRGLPVQPEYEEPGEINGPEDVSPELRDEAIRRLKEEAAKHGTIFEGDTFENLRIIEQNSEDTPEEQTPEGE